MRIHILSDLHLEFAPFQLVQSDADVIVLAGDIHTGANGFKWIRETFPKQQIIYVLGNHEFYGQKIPKLTEELKAVAVGTNIHVLENDAIEIGDVIFLGATLDGFPSQRRRGFGGSDRADRHDGFPSHSHDANLPAVSSGGCAANPHAIFELV